MTTQEVKRKLTVILSTDVERYSCLQSNQDEMWRRKGAEMNWKKPWFFLSMIWILVLGQGAWLSALAQTQEPILRIEMGMHTSIITSIGVDDQNQFIVTGSQDKTVRLWELSTGRLLRIFRPPIGEGPIGMIFAVAI